MRFRKDFLIDGKVVHCQKRKSGKKTMNYMLRYRRNGFNICATSNDLEEAKRKFIQSMQKAVNQESAVKFGKMNTVQTDFHGFAEYYFEKYRKRKVSEKTFENDKYRYKNHLQPRFGKMQLSEITPYDCQEFLDGYEKQGKHKTTRELYSLLNCIFKMAMAHGIVERNPLAVVIVLKYEEKHGKALTKEEEKHGKALTKEEEKLLLEKSKGSKYQQIFALSLYTGLRPNELFTAKIDGNFIVAKNSKRKGKKVEYKKIPISIMLKPYLENVENFEFPTLEYIRKAFN
ncbi:MAG: phage integrase SAM-like domain-containing protein [Clostridia bacterium]|nr:phage integrase SAM-like domain-containing protein [Clostridia bacterium]